MPKKTHDPVARERNRIINIHIGKRLYQKRTQLGLTLDALAEALSTAHDPLTFQQLHKYENGASIKASRLWQLAQVLEVPVTYFYDGVNFQVEASAAHKLAA